MTTNLWTQAFLVACLATAGAIQPATAQHDVDDDSVDVVVEVDEGGRILVDGRPVADGDGRVVVRVRRDGRVAVEDRRRGARVVRVPARHARPFARQRTDGFVPPRPVRIRSVEPIVERLRMEFDGIEALVEEHHEVADLERESRALAAQARRASAEERRELESQLREKLAEIFEKKMELRRERLALVEERLEDQRAELQERSAARADIIERRHNELLGESDVLEW